MDFAGEVGHSFWSMTGWVGVVKSLYIMQAMIYQLIEYIDKTAFRKKCCDAYVNYMFYTKPTNYENFKVL